MLKILQRIIRPKLIIAQNQSITKNYKNIKNVPLDYFNPYLGQNNKLQKKALSWALKKLKSHKGIIIGDCPHSRPHTKHFIARNLGKFKDAGVKHIYSEYFSTNNQEALDRFFTDGNNIDEIKKILSNSLGANYAIDLLKESRKLRIRTFGIEMPNHCDSLSERNKHWTDTANLHIKELQPDEKFILFGGSAHLSNSMNTNGLLKTSKYFFNYKHSGGIDLMMKTPALSTTINYNCIRNYQGLFKKLTSNLCFLDMPYHE